VARKLLLRRPRVSTSPPSVEAEPPVEGEPAPAGPPSVAAGEQRTRRPTRRRASPRAPAGPPVPQDDDAEIEEHEEPEVSAEVTDIRAYLKRRRLLVPAERASAHDFIDMTRGPA
jgi:hypothetical protein